MDDFEGADAAVELETWESYGLADFEGLEPALRVRLQCMRHASKYFTIFSLLALMVGK